MQNPFFGIFDQFFREIRVQIEHDRFFRLGQNTLGVSVHVLGFEVPFGNDGSFLHPVRIRAEIVVIQGFVPHTLVGIAHPHTPFGQQIHVTLDARHVLVNNPRQLEFHPVPFLQHLVHENHLASPGLLVTLEGGTRALVREFIPIGNTLDLVRDLDNHPGGVLPPSHDRVNRFHGQKSFLCQYALQLGLLLRSHHAIVLAVHVQFIFRSFLETHHPGRFLPRSSHPDTFQHLTGDKNISPEVFVSDLHVILIVRLVHGENSVHPFHPFLEEFVKRHGTFLCFRGRLLLFRGFLLLPDTR